MAYHYNGNLFAFDVATLLSSEFRQDLGQFLVELSLPPLATLDWMNRQFDEVHCGTLFSQSGKPLDHGALSPFDLWPRRLLRRSCYLNNMKAELWSRGAAWSSLTIDVNDLFGLDEASTIKSMKAWAETPPVELGQHHTAPRIMFVDFARRIHLGAIEQSKQ